MLRNTYDNAALVERMFEARIVPILRERLYAHIDAVPLVSGQRTVLDVGCGEQPLRARLERAGYLYTGLDVQQNSRGTVDVVAAIDEPIAASRLDRAFDLVVCTEVLEHVFDWGAAFASLSRWTRPGGHVVLSVPFVFPLHLEPTDFWRPTPHAIQQAAVRHDFEVVHLERAGGLRDVIVTVLGVATPPALPWPFFRTRFAPRANRAYADLREALRRAATSLPATEPSTLYLANVGTLRRKT